MDMDLPLDVTSTVALIRALILAVVMFLIQGLMIGHATLFIREEEGRGTRIQLTLLVIQLALTVIEDHELQSLRVKAPMINGLPLVMAKKTIHLALEFSLIYTTAQILSLIMRMRSSLL